MSHSFEIPAEGGSLNQTEFIFVKSVVEPTISFPFEMAANFEKGIVTATVDKPAEVAPLQAALAHVMKAPLLQFRKEMDEKAKADAWAAREAAKAEVAEETSDDDTKPDDTKPDDTKPDDTKPDDTKKKGKK